MSKLTRTYLESLEIEELKAMVRVSLAGSIGPVMRAGIHVASRETCIQYLLNGAERAQTPREA